MLRPADLTRRTVVDAAAASRDTAIGRRAASTRGRGGAGGRFRAREPPVLAARLCRGGGRHLDLPLRSSRGLARRAVGRRDPHGYDLCERHAARLRVPHGWRLEDRRSSSRSPPGAGRRLTPASRGILAGPRGCGRCCVASPCVRPAPGEPRFQAGTPSRPGWWRPRRLQRPDRDPAAAGLPATQSEERPLWLDAVLQVPLWVSLLGGVVIISRRWGTGRLREDYGLRFRAFDVLGIPIGIVTQAVLVPALYWASCRSTRRREQPGQALTDRAGERFRVVLLVLMVVVGAPIIEELFFRGLLMRSIQARWNDGLALVASSVFFGLVHFQPLQFPGLVLFGLIAGTCAQRTGRLGMSILAHSGVQRHGCRPAPDDVTVGVTVGG